MNLPKEWLETIVEEVSKEFSKRDKARNEEQKDRRLRNTEYLLKNYRKLKSHCEIELEHVKKNEEIFEKITVNSVMEYKIKSIKMVDYIDRMLDAYGYYCESQGKSVLRRYQVIKALYITPQPDKVPTRLDLAERLNVEERTIRRDEKKAIDEFAVYLFGITHFTDLVEEMSV